MKFIVAITVIFVITHADNTVNLHGTKSDNPEFKKDDDVDRSPWQPGTPPLTLLRLLGIGQSRHHSDPSHRRPPLSDDTIIPGLIPLNNVGKTNQSSVSSSSFFAGFSRPEVAGRQLPGASRRQKSGNNASGKSKPEVYVGDGTRLPHLQITPRGKQRWLSADRDVTLSSKASVDDVTDTTKTGNTTDDYKLSTKSKTSLSITPPISLNRSDNVTFAPEVGSTNQVGVVESEKNADYEQPDDNETHGEGPFHAVPRHHLPIWPVPRHHMTIYPSEQQQHFVPPSFDGFPKQNPMHGIPGSSVYRPAGHGTLVHSFNLPPVNGQPSEIWNRNNGPALDSMGHPVLNPVNQDATDIRMSTNTELKLEENFDRDPKQHKSGPSVEEDRTTWTSPGNSIAVLSDSNTYHSSMADEVMTTMLSSVKSTFSSTPRGRNALWGAASWRHSAGNTISATTVNLLGTLVLSYLVVLMRII